MVTLLQAQKQINLDPVVNLTVGGTSLNGLVGRYKYREKADSFGRAAIWLDNTNGRFNDLASDYPTVKRGAEVVVSRGVRTKAGVELTADLPSLWVDTMLYVLFRNEPFLVLDCIDWVGRLRYYRYGTETTWTGKLVETIVSDLLGNVGLTLAAGAFSTALSINYTITRSRSAWSALRAVMAKVPEVLYTGTGKEIQWKVLNPDAPADYDFDLNPAITSDDHPLLDDSDVAEATPRYNSITVAGGTALEYTATAEDATEIALMGYRRRRYISDRSLGSNAECATRAEAELDFWSARSTAGVIVARPHFTVRLFDVVSAPAPLWGGPPIGAGHVTRIVEWYNFGSRDYDQALTIGEVPDAAVVAIGNNTQPLPPNDDDEDEQDAGSGDETGSSDGSEDEGGIESDQIADDAIGPEHISALPSARVYNNANETTADEVEEFLDFNTERWDTDSIHSTSTNPSRLTAKTPGKYLVTANITFTYPSSGTAIARVDLVKNTSTILATQIATRLSTIDEDLPISLSTMVEMAVDDYVRVQVYQAGFGSVDVLAGSASAQNNQDFEMTFMSG